MYIERIRINTLKTVTIPAGIIFPLLIKRYPIATVKMPLTKASKWKFALMAAKAAANPVVVPAINETALP
jgi:hypothetical protein